MLGAGPKLGHGRPDSNWHIAAQVTSICVHDPYLVILGRGGHLLALLVKGKLVGRINANSPSFILDQALICHGRL